MHVSACVTSHVCMRVWCDRRMFRCGSKRDREGEEAANQLIKLEYKKLGRIRSVTASSSTHILMTSCGPQPSALACE